MLGLEAEHATGSHAERTGSYSEEAFDGAGTCQRR